MTSAKSEAHIERDQRAFCSEWSAHYLACSALSKIGFALSTKGEVPINGLRHPPQGDTTGWYLWCGEEWSDSPDFFQPIHTHHLYTDFPNVVRFLGLAPGYRFLLAEDHLDVWYDPSLLKT